MKPNLKDFCWMAIGAAVLLGFMLLVMHYQGKQNPAAQLAFKAKRVETVERMRLALASASEAEKSSVMAVTDEDSQTYADQARAAASTVEQGRLELENLLEPHGTQGEKDELAQFSKDFSEFQRVDKDLLALAVMNTNLKAYSLAYGPAAVALKDMDTALAQIIALHGNTASEDTLKILQLADGARIAALRLQALLPPHIAEESGQKMDEMEAVMAKEDQAARQNLDGLAALASLGGNPDLAAANASYTRFTDLRTQILKLSRENTNVRSLTMSLSQKRKVMMACQDSLDALEQAIQAEPIAGLSNHNPVSPR